VLLFHDHLMEQIVESLSEIGVPLTDPAPAEHAPRQPANVREWAEQMESEHTFAEISELLRLDVASGLCALGMPRIVLQHLIGSPHLWSLLALCATRDSIGLAISNPELIRELSRGLSYVALGETKIGDAIPLLLFLHKAFHFKEVCMVLIGPLRDPLKLVSAAMALPCADAPDDRRSIAQLLFSMVVRSCVRHGCDNVLDEMYTTTDALTSWRNGSLVVLEIYVLQCFGGPVPSRGLDSFLVHASHQVVAALLDDTIPMTDVPVGGPERLRLKIFRATAFHFLATLLSVIGPVSLTLFGDAVQSQSTALRVAQKCIVTPEALASLFCSTRRRQQKIALNEAISADLRAQISAVELSESHGHARLSVSLARAFPATAQPIVGFLSSALLRFIDQFVCGEWGRSVVELNDTIKADELCTIIEILLFLPQQMHDVPNAENGSYSRESSISDAGVGSRQIMVAAALVFHSIVATRHGLDAIDAVANLICKDPNGKLAGFLTQYALGGIERAAASVPSREGAVQQHPNLQGGWLSAPIPYLPFEWSQWMRNLFSLDRDLRRVLPWDATFADLILWCASHRQRPELDDALVTLSQVAMAEGAVSTAVSMNLCSSIRGALNPSAEEPISPPLLAAMSVACALTPPSVSIAIVRLLVECRPSMPCGWPDTCSADDHRSGADWASNERIGAMLSDFMSEQNVEDLWMRRRHSVSTLRGVEHVKSTLSADDSRGINLEWTLQDVVELLQAIGCDFDAWLGATWPGRIAKHCLLSFLRRRRSTGDSALSPFERNSLLEIANDLQWAPQWLIQEIDPTSRCL
jgi:hypothetical protein